jgi:glycerol-3-phosphate O-acyltransferase / dihydroxyacetone phosphate acyltransferase
MAALVGRTAALYYDLEPQGGPIPVGPVLIVANHPNSLLDPLIVFRVAGRPARPLAKAGLFRHTLIGPALRGLGGLPVYRRQDEPALLHLNEGTFDAAVAVLRAGAALQIYPEGKSHSEPGLAPLRTGAARIALQAETEAGWTLGLKLVPVGLTYERKSSFKSRALALVGEPFTIGHLRKLHAASPSAAIRALTAEIARRIEALTLSLSEAGDRELIDAADRLYAREKGWVHWRQREGLGERLPRLQAFARGLAYLRAHDPQRHARLSARLRSYRELARRLGAGEADVPPRYPLAEVLRYGVREGSALIAGAPFALAGVLTWYVPYLLPRMIVRLFRPDYETIASYKLGISLFAFPGAYATWIMLAWWLAGAGAALAAAAVLPALGAVALAWALRWGRVREDAALFLRVLRTPGERDRLVSERRELVRELDAIARLIGTTPAGSETPAGS